MSWEIVGQIGPHTRSGIDATGWLWEIRRGGGEWPSSEVRRVLVEVTGTVHATDRTHLPRDTAEALSTQGESEVRKVLDLDDPPRVVQCATDGCRPAPG